MRPVFDTCCTVCKSILECTTVSLSVFWLFMNYDARGRMGQEENKLHSVSRYKNGEILKRSFVSAAELVSVLSFSKTVATLR